MGAGNVMLMPGTCLPVKLLKNLTVLSQRLFGCARTKTSPIRMKTVPTEIALIMLSPGPLTRRLSHAGFSPIFSLLILRVVCCAYNSFFAACQVNVLNSHSSLRKKRSEVYAILSKMRKQSRGKHDFLPQMRGIIEGGGTSAS